MFEMVCFRMPSLKTFSLTAFLVLKVNNYKQEYISILKDSNLVKKKNFIYETEFALNQTNKLYLEVCTLFHYLEF